MELDPTKHKLTEAENRRIFDVQIVPFLFTGIEASELPVAQFVGGQPGAGKTILQSRFKREADIRQAHTTVSVMGDDFRSFHPLYADLLGIDDTIAAYYTDADSGSWIEKSLEYARGLRCNTLIEGTLRNADVSLHTAESFKTSGYRVEFNILAVHGLMSRVGILLRYFEQLRDTGVGRFTVDEAHERAYTAIPETIRALATSRHIDTVRYFRRGGVLMSTFSPNAAIAGDAKIAYERLRDESLDEHAVRELRLQIEMLHSMAEEFGRVEFISRLHEISNELERENT